MTTVKLKLLVEKETNKVVFAESDKEFVDILFSFLTLPMGTIIRLLDKQSSLGCMDKLYKSVENLNSKYLETEACKTMLLQPRSEAEILCGDLRVNVDRLDPRRLYRCPSSDCYTKNNRIYSSFSGARCHCGTAMNTCCQGLRKENDAKYDVFLKGAATYIISDDLRIAPATVSAIISLLKKLGIKDANVLEERIVDVRVTEVLSLLKSLLLSKTPFTDIFLQKVESKNIDKEENETVETAQIKSEVKYRTFQAKRISVKLLQNETTKEVMYAEAGSDFVDVLLSFLTFPLGSIVKLLNKQSTIGCIDNLYNSAEVLAATGDYIKSEECKNMLLCPKLYPYFNCDNQIMRIEEKLSAGATVQGCKICWSKCIHNIANVRLNEINPKLPNSVTDSGGGYAKRTVKFKITDEMDVTPMSPVSVIDMIKELGVPINSLVENEIKLGEAEVLNLLKACLISSNPLCQLFPHKKKRTV